MTPTSHAPRCDHRIAACLGALWCCTALSPSHAVGMQEQDTLLDVREKFIQLKLARNKLSQFLPLAEKGIVSKSDFDQQRTNSELAEIKFQRAALDMMSGEPRINVERAVKVKDEHGQHFLELTLRNATQVLDDAQRALITSLDKDGDFPRELWQQQLNNVFISVKESPTYANAMPGGMSQSPVVAQAAIALPYVTRIGSWGFNETKSLRFKLLINAERFNIHVNHRSSERVLGVYAEQHFSGADVELSSSRVSQEANLGTAIDYPFEIHRSGQDSRTFQLQAYNLPASVRHSFVERDSKNRVSQLRMSTGETTKALLLRIELPDKQVAGLSLDAALPFFVVASEEDRAASLPPGGAAVAAEQLAGLAFTELKLVARGVGKPVLNAASLVYEVEQGKPSRLEFTIKNEGSRAIENLRFDSERPTGFNAKFEPDQIGSLGVGQERKVSLEVSAPDQANAGDFELRVKTEGYSAAQPLAIEDKSFRLVVKQSTSNWPLLALALLLAGVLAVVIYVGQKVRVK